MLLKKSFLKFILPIASFALLNTNPLLYATTSENTIFPATDSRIHYIGRSYQTGKDAISICWPGTSIKTNFQGTSVGIYLENMPNDYPDANYINVFIDGKQLEPIKCDRSTDYILLEDGLEDTVHTLEIFKRSDGNAGPITLKGISLDKHKELVSPEEEDLLKIEFYGDSILSGAAVEAPTYLDKTDEELKALKLEREPFSEFSTWNNYLAFPAITARNLNADYSCISQGGVGLTNSSIPGLNMKMLWNQAGGPTDWKIGPDNKSYIWDFSQSTPADYVIISLGGNDIKYGIQGDFKTEYIQFINTIRSQYPLATILCVTTPPSINDSPSIAEPIKSAVETLNANGDTNVFYYRFHEYTPYEIYEHPRVETQKALSDELTKVIKEHIASNLEVTFNITGQYDTGSNVDFTLTNHNDFPITNWIVDCTLDEEEVITNLWNAKFTTQENVITIQNQDFNATIPPNSSITFGAQISNDGELHLTNLNCGLR